MKRPTRVKIVKAEDSLTVERNIGKIFRVVEWVDNQPKIYIDKFNYAFPLVKGEWIPIGTDLKFTDYEL